MRPRELTILGSVIAAVIVVFWLAFFALPPLAVGDDVGKTRAERTKLRNDFRSTETQFLGGLALAAGLLFTWRTLRLNREGQLTDRFSKAIDQLGDEKLDVRLGGIYSLERIAWDSKRDDQAVTEVLTAYVRKYRRREDEEDESPHDVQAIMTVLGRPNPAHERRRLDLTLADLRHVQLTEANLTNARLGYARLGSAQLAGSDLAGATLFGADLRTALFLDLAILEGAIDDEGTKWPDGFDPAAAGVRRLLTPEI